MDRNIGLLIGLLLFGLTAVVIFASWDRGQTVGNLAESPTGATQATPVPLADTPLSGTQTFGSPALAPDPGSEVQSGSSIASGAIALPIRHIVATYFHNTTRCVTCRTIEQQARETMESAFADDLSSGRLVWRARNMEESEYEHYATDYSLVSPSLVLTEMDGEREVRFKVLGETWKLVHNRLRFASYVESETRAFLEGL